MVLIIGASGIVGNCLLEALIQAKFKVRAVYHSQKPDFDKVEWVKGDILDIASIEEALMGITHVFHCAGFVSFAKKDKQKLYEVNVTGTTNVVNACLKYPDIKLCYVSSVAAIGQPVAKYTIIEEDRWEAGQSHSYYSKSKYWAENEVWRGVNEGLNAVIVNPSIILGGTNGGRSSTQLLAYALKEPLFYFNGQCNFVDLRDVVDIMMKLTFSTSTNQRFIINGFQCSLFDFFSEVATIANKKPPKFELGYAAALTIAALETLRSYSTGSSPLISFDSVKRSTNKVYYSSEKVIKLLDYTFRDKKDTLKWAVSRISKVVL